MKTLLVAFFFLVFGTGTAFAECAWIVWQRVSVESTLSATVGWEPVAGHNQREQCEGQAIHFSKTAGGEKTIMGNKTFTVYICLPDTVDPRGPKGK